MFRYSSSLFTLRRRRFEYKIVEHQGESEFHSKLSGEFINVYYEIDEYIRQYSSIDKIQET